MKNATAKSRPRPRKSAATPVPSAPAAPVAAPDDEFRNVGSFESASSLVLGALFLVGALFPRSIKQGFLLALGGGLVYRGMTSHCGVYKALGLNSEKGSLLGQINEKYLSNFPDKNG